MKNFTKVLLVILLAGASIGVKAQYYGYHYSGHDYRGNHYIPHKVKRVVHQYHRFEWVETTQIRRGHRQLFVITLRQQNRFIELTINHHGDVISKHRYVIKRHYIPHHPHRRGYADRRVIYYNDGYVYSRRDDRRSYQWQPDQNDWDVDNDRDERPSGIRNR